MAVFAQYVGVLGGVEDDVIECFRKGGGVVLTGIRRTLRDDGIYLMQEIRGSSHVHANIGHPLGTFLYTVSCMHCMTVSLAQGGEGVGAMWGEELARDYLARAGFRSVEKHELAHDIQNDWYVVTK